MTETFERDSATMDPATETQEDQAKKTDNQTLKVSRFDSVTSGLLSVIIFLGAFVMMMFVMWLLSVEPRIPAQKMPVAKQAGHTKSQGDTLEFEQPTAEEIEALAEPTIEHTVEALTDAASTVAASASISSDQSGLKAGSSGGGDALEIGGDARSDLIPRWERWELKFNARGKEDYARQLDFYGIELAAFGGTGPNVIEMATDLASKSRRRVNEKPESENRLYFSWLLDNPLVEFDRQLLASAGISTQGRHVVRFISAELENQLAILERDHCLSNGKTFPQSIAKTVFESQPNESGYQFKVIRQRYR